MTEFHLPPVREENRVYASGKWSVLSSMLRHAADVDEKTDCLVIQYRAVSVDVVMRPEGNYWKRVLLTQDGKWLSRDIAGSDVKFDEKGRSCVEVWEPRLYNVIAVQPYGVHELRLYSQGKGLSVYSLSFGTSEIP